MTQKKFSIKKFIDHWSLIIDHSPPKRGFTLIELLVVLAIFVLVLLAVNQILFATLRGSAKSEVTARVKREAERVVSVMERLLHNSRAIVSCGPQQVVYMDQAGVQNSFVCQAGRVELNNSALTSSDVNVSSCSISCESSGGIPNKAVRINLTFEEQSGLGLRVEERARIDLQTRVLLRN